MPRLEAAAIKRGLCRVVTLEEAQRRYILYVLIITNWRIKGPGGAAELLDVPASTLYSKMKKLGIPTLRQLQNAKNVMLQIEMDFCVALISYKLGSPKGGVHVEEA